MTGGILYFDGQGNGVSGLIVRFSYEDRQGTLRVGMRLIREREGIRICRYAE